MCMNAKRNDSGKPDNKRKARRDRSRLFGMLFLAYLLTAFAGVIVFAALRIYVGMGICFGLFAGTIFISIIVASTASARARKAEKARLTRAVAECVDCMDCGESDDGKNYRIEFRINGHTLYARSRNTYDAGERVEIEFASERSASCDIVGED